MPKVKVKSWIQSEEDGNSATGEFYGILRDSVLSYDDNGILTKLDFRESDLHIVRRGRDYVLDFKLLLHETGTGCYDIQNVGMLCLETHTNILEVSQDRIYTEYELNINGVVTSRFIFEVKVEGYDECKG